MLGRYLGMLRRADNVSYYQERVSFWTGQGRSILTIGKTVFELGKWSRAEFQERLDFQLRRPLRVTTIKGKRYWMFGNRFYWESEGLSSDEVQALVAMQEQRKKKQLETAQLLSALGSGPRVATGRKAIPDDVKVYIFNRDAGSCRACGSTTEIQYDHIIPLKLGGSNEVENLQILCGPCNRSKSAGLTTRR